MDDYIYTGNVLQRIRALTKLYNHQYLDSSKRQSYLCLNNTFANLQSSLCLKMYLVEFSRS